MSLATEEVRTFKSYTEDFSDVVEIEYEEMFDGERFSETLTAKLCEAFKIPDLFNRQPALDRISKFSYESLVANYADIVARVNANDLS